MILHFKNRTVLSKPQELLMHSAASRVGVLGVFFLFCIVIPLHAATPTQKCPSRWIDSLVNAGKRNLDNGNISNASRYFSIAYNCGMCKDSMFYFAAELYMRAMALDTALTFNWGLEKSGHLPQKLYLEQRSRIFRLMGWKRQADSILTLIRKKVRYDLSMNVCASRNILTLDPISIPPKSNFTFRLNEIIDDIGDAEIRNKLTFYSDKRFKQTFIMLNFKGDFKIPTRYSFTDQSDTILRSISCFAGAGQLPLTPECMYGHRWAIHPDKKIDHFDKVSLSFPFIQNGYLSINHDTKWTPDRVCDDKTDLLFSRFSFRRNVSWFRTISATHHFTKFNQYEKQSGSSGIYPMIPLGYTDSLSLNDSSESKILYYRDRNLTQLFDTDTNCFLNDYWVQQPSMRLVTQPEHDLNAALNSSLQFNMPLGIVFNVYNSLRCAWYPKKVQWFAVDDSVQIDFYKMYKDFYGVVFNSSDGKYYINRERTQSGYVKNSMVELKKQEKTRIDCYFTMTVNIEKGLDKLGKIYFSTSYLKVISTLPEKVPLINIDQNWEFQAGWTKEISVVK